MTRRAAAGAGAVFIVYANVLYIVQSAALKRPRGRPPRRSAPVLPGSHAPGARRCARAGRRARNTEGFRPRRRAARGARGAMPSFAPRGRRGGARAGSCAGRLRVWRRRLRRGSVAVFPARRRRRRRPRIVSSAIISGKSPAVSAAVRSAAGWGAPALGARSAVGGLLRWSAEGAGVRAVGPKRARGRCRGGAGDRGRVHGGRKPGPAKGFCVASGRRAPRPGRVRKVVCRCSAGPRPIANAPSNKAQESVRGGVPAARRARFGAGGRHARRRRRRRAPRGRRRGFGPGCRRRGGGSDGCGGGLAAAFGGRGGAGGRPGAASRRRVTIASAPTRGRGRD